MNPRHIYVHVPFCDGKCLYCGFYSQAYDKEPAQAYLSALAKEMDMTLKIGPKPAPVTVYFGGGTPSILPPPQLEALCRIILDRVSVWNLREWTVEANPGTLSPEKIAILHAAGVNRISIGVQSFNDRGLKRIGRRHTAADVAPTVDLLRTKGFKNIGLDLIAALPGVTAQMWRETLNKTLELQLTHISVYALTVEEDTRLGQLVAAKKLKAPTDAAQLRAIAMAEELLESAGFERYEISNYAKNGFRSLHNLSYWRGEDYLGFGPAASSRIGLKRWTNASDIISYTAALAKRKEPPREKETLAPEIDSIERIVFGFRLKEGVCLKDFDARAELVSKWEKAITRLSMEGFVEHGGKRWFPTKRGFQFADYVAGELLNSVSKKKSGEIV